MKIYFSVLGAIFDHSLVVVDLLCRGGGTDRLIATPSRAFPPRHDRQSGGRVDESQSGGGVRQLVYRVLRLGAEQVGGHQ